jgi:CheY-like chemotaxis protein
MPNKRILLVEDYPANVLVATTLLEDFGYEYDVATNASDAISKIKAGGFAAALMDVELGEPMCGFEATRHVRDWEKTASIRKLPIIAMTAHALAGDREKCLDAGMDDYISKPFDADELRDKLERHAQAHAA